MSTIFFIEAYCEILLLQVMGNKYYLKETFSAEVREQGLLKEDSG